MRRKIIFFITILVLSMVLSSYAYGSTIPETKPEKEIVKAVDISKKIIESTDTLMEASIESIPPPEKRLTNEEIDLIALVTMAEAEGQPELGQRYVIDVILNRLDSGRFPDTIDGVIYAKNQFECMWNGRVERCEVREDIRQLVIEEIQNRSHDNIYYFRAGQYHDFGIPIVQEGDHYFSSF